MRFGRLSGHIVLIIPGMIAWLGAVRETPWFLPDYQRSGVAMVVWCAARGRQ